MRGLWLFLFAALLPTRVHANDWEKFYRPLGPTDTLIPSTSDPIVLPFDGNLEATLEFMWRKGFVAIGYTSFETGNSKTKDAVKFGKKIKARYIIISTNLTSTRTTSIPITTPTSTTSVSSGTVTAYGNGRQVTGNYSGSTTTYGNSTTYFPITLNRYKKEAIYFMEVPKSGTGIYTRELNAQEIKLVETRRAIAVRWVRDESPAYYADIIPGDIIIGVNDQPYSETTWKAAISSGNPIKVEIFRNGRVKLVSLVIPPDWRLKGETQSSEDTAAIAMPAASLRIPVEGTPALVVDRQEGWTEKYDDYGNLTLFADDSSGGLLLRMIEVGPDETIPSNTQVAELILGAAGAEPPSRSEKTNFAGGEAEAYYSTMRLKGAPPIAVTVVIRKVGDRHLAVGVTMIPETTQASGKEKVEALFGKVTISSR